MGGGRWSPSDWKDYTTTRSYATKTAATIYTSRNIHKDLDPKGVAMRESRDSDLNPNSNAVIVALDVTGSMDPVLESVAKEGLNKLITEMYSRKPVVDPHVMLMAVGDVECDSAPLQVTQFEADIRLAEQLEKIYLEKGGGGNSYESYILPWYFAAMHTSIDCFEKRGRKGYLFTIGDENPTPKIKADAFKRFLGEKQATDIDTLTMLTMVSRMYHVFHVIVEEGDHCRHSHDTVVNSWTKLLGQRALKLSDHTKLSEVIVSAIQANEGEDTKDVVSSWTGDTSIVVAHALSGYAVDKRAEAGVVRF